MLNMSIKTWSGQEPRRSGYTARDSGSLVPAMARSICTSRRNRNSLAGRPPVSAMVAPVSSTSRCCSISRRKVLLVQMPPGQRLDGALQLEQGEVGRHQLEHHRPVFDLGPQPGDGGGEDAAVVVQHRVAGHRHRGVDAETPRPPAPTRPRTASRSAAGPGPRSRAMSVESEGQRRPRSIPVAPDSAVRPGLSPPAQAGRNALGDDRRALAARASSQGK